MLVPNQLIEVIINSTNFQFYKDLGYNVHKGDAIHAPPNELKDGSHLHVSLICDVCQEPFEREYRQY